MQAPCRTHGWFALTIFLCVGVLLIPTQGVGQTQKQAADVKACDPACKSKGDCSGCSASDQQKQCNECAHRGGKADEPSTKEKWQNTWNNLKDPGKLMGVIQHSRPAKTTKEIEDVFKHLEEHHGIDRKLASERLHKIKQENGLGGADNVILDYTGNVYSPQTLELVGSLTEGGAKAPK